MHVSVEVRLKLRDQTGQQVMLVRGNELRRSGRRMLIPFGGSMRATSQDVALFRRRGVLASIKPGNDLLFPFGPEREARTLAEAIKRQFSRARIEAEARRELIEEAVKERKLLGMAEVKACSFTYLQTIIFADKSYRKATQGKPMLYVINIVEVSMPEVTLGRLANMASRPSANLEFIAPRILKKDDGAYTGKRSFVPPIYFYLA